MLDDIFNGFMLSVDVAHALHPNFAEKSDITNKIILNGGVVIKEAANQAYAGDTIGISVIKQLCNEHNIPYQIFVNRSDMPGGYTLGSILSASVPIRTVDVGVPILAMHSARELMGAKDQKNLENLLTVYYS
jgi:aspartyl aminopeptidase